MRTHVAAMLLVGLYHAASARPAMARRRLPARCGSTTSTPATRPGERFSLDRVVLEPLPWPGNPARPIDDTNLGKYLFEVIDRATNRLLYSRGFASIYGEWETTGEAKEIRRTFHESLRFPAPAAPVQVVAQEARRAATPSARSGRCSSTRRTSSSTVRAARRPAPLIEIQKNGDPAREGRLPDPRRRLHRRRARQVREGRAAAGRHPLRRRALQGAPRATSTSGRSARRPRSPGSRGRRPASTAARRSAPPTTPSAPSATC